jgi:hypothetical protein
MVIKRLSKALPSRASMRATRSAYRRGGVMSATNTAIGTMGAAPLKVLAETAKDLRSPAGKFFSILTKNKSILGINLGIGSILKQSQVFTGAISTLMQIIGAMVDVAIAPFLVPLFLPLAKKMVSFIPKVREWSAKLAEEWVPKIKNLFDKLVNGDGTIWERLGEFIGGAWDLIWKDTGLSKWWGEQTGVLGLLTKGLSGAATGVRKVYNFLIGMIDGPFNSWYANVGWNALSAFSQLVAPIGADWILGKIFDWLEGKMTQEDAPNFQQVPIHYEPPVAPVAFQDLYEKSGAGLGANYSPYGGNA